MRNSRMPLCTLMILRGMSMRSNCLICSAKWAKWFQLGFAGIKPDNLLLDTLMLTWSTFKMLRMPWNM
ncbi:hypothetical protein GLYMA_11G195750v4 [Glycine max]|nr:hypothetical protein GLYMA_11G195750v4 [Glycine max]KAH1159417.1 hypothetical protein GYH30_031230 [Glycine max]